MTELRGEGSLSGSAYSTSIATGWFGGVQRPVTDPKTTSMGIEVDKTFTILETKPIEADVRQYELLIDGESVWSGAGDDRVDALLEAIQAATGQSDELPN